MQLDKATEQEIATRLNLIKPICPDDVAAYIADGEAFRNAMDKYDRPSFSWRATTDEARAVIVATRNAIDRIQELADKLDSHSETVILAQRAFYTESQRYNEAIQTELYKPRLAFEKARDEFSAAMAKEMRSIQRKYKQTSTKRYDFANGSPEREALQQQAEALQQRLNVVETLYDESRYLNYDSEERQVFSEELVWQQIAKAEHKANRFIGWIKNLELPETEQN